MEPYKQDKYRYNIFTFSNGKKIIKAYDIPQKRTLGPRTKQKRTKQRKYRPDNSKLMKRNLLFLVEENFVPGSTFVTLTYAENMTSTERSSVDFNFFLKRLRRYFAKRARESRAKHVVLKYVAVRERQKRGSIHWHIVMNKRIKHSDLELLWGFGFVDIKSTRNVNHMGAYLAKYLSKENEFPKNTRRVIASRSCNRPNSVKMYSLPPTFFQHNTVTQWDTFSNYYRGNIDTLYTEPKSR
jgi:hypothetical protein